ncbi:MAG TPA: hypothetical protein VJY84_03295 [Candidatus Saccharimonadales bacterium]|nr:hypothetical protein [Candidatus Saccharimonadales bacterium]
MTTSAQKGFSHLILILAVVVLSIIGFAGWRIYETKSKSATTFQVTNSSSGAVEKVTWARTTDGWKVSGTPPACPNPLVKLPVDISQATSILYPGQTRGGDFKPHGGFRFDIQKDNSVTVTAPLDAELVYASRYIEMGELQYMFDFIAPCGYTYRFDHLLAVGPKFQTVVDQLPEAKENNSRTSTVSPSVPVKTGETIATQIGMNQNRLNVFFDWGLYDMRSKNQASQDGAWAAAHNFPNAQHGVCWFDFLSAEDEAKVRALPASDSDSGSTSAFCK